MGIDLDLETAQRSLGHQSGLQYLTLGTRTPPRVGFRALSVLWSNALDLEKRKSLAPRPYRRT